MKNRLTTLPGTPHRVRVQEPEEPEEKVDRAEDMDEVVPSPIRIEVGGGRSSTASAMRAARVQQELEEVGAVGETVALDGQHATVAAEADRRQALYVARLPFVKKVSKP